MLLRSAAEYFLNIWSYPIFRITARQVDASTRARTHTHSFSLTHNRTGILWRMIRRAAGINPTDEVACSRCKVLRVQHLSIDDIVSFVDQKELSAPRASPMTAHQRKRHTKRSITAFSPLGGWFCARRRPSRARTEQPCCAHMQSAGHTLPNGCMVVNDDRTCTHG